MTDHLRFLQPPDTHFFLFGPRGTGKTTWLRSALPDAIWIDLLDPATERELASYPERLVRYVEAAPSPATVVLDEVQRAPGVLTVVHRLIETHRSGLRFVLTGSSARRLKRSGVDLLAHRAQLRFMHPFLAAELGTAFDLDRALELGMVPGVLGAVDPMEARRAYLALYIREEVKAEGHVRNLDSFGRFVEAISFSHGAPLNLANVARECHVSRATVDGFVGVLEDLLLAWRMGVFQKRAQRQLSVHPKFWWFDAGVYRSIRPAGPLDRREEIDGMALEGLVAQHLRAWLDLGARDAKLHFWRTKSGLEVDFVGYGPNLFFALEVKNAARVDAADVRGLRAFATDYPEAELRLLYRGTRRQKVGGVLCMPVGEFLASLRPGAALPA